MTHIARQSVGTARVTVLTDGTFSFPPDLFPGTAAEHIDALLAAASETAIRTNFNAVLIRNGDRCILIDAGPRDLFGPTCGNLPAALAEAGVTPEQIDTIFATHLHPDHVAGLITPDGAAVFSNAELVLSAGEHGFWSDPANTTATETLAGWGQLARAVLAAYGDRLRPIAADGQIAPGLHALALPGHTPGHSGWRLESDGEQMLHVGDIVHAPALQVADPEIAIVFDLDIDTARATRKRLLDMLAADDLQFTGGHFLQPALCRVVRHGSGYRLA